MNTDTTTRTDAEILTFVDERTQVIVYYDVELDDARLKPAPHRAYCRIARRCAGATAGKCTESLPSMADGCEMSEPTLKRALRVLLERRMIRRMSRRGQTSYYALLDKRHWLSYAEWRERYPKQPEQAETGGEPRSNFTQVPAGNPDQILPTPRSNFTHPPGKDLIRHEDIEPKKENKKENKGGRKRVGKPVAPPEVAGSLSLGQEAAAQRREIMAALKDILPGEANNADRISELTKFVMDQGASAPFVLRWPDWMSERYPAVIPNWLKFKDTFRRLAREGLDADAWLNGSIGARFVAYASGVRSQGPVPAKTANEVTTVGHWLDKQVNQPDKADWYSRGITPPNFEQFWQSLFPTAHTRPSAHSIQKYWPDFIIWLEESSGDEPDSK